MVNAPLIRQRIAEVETITKLTKWNRQRVRAARAAGRPPGPEGSLAKLMGSEVSRKSARAHTDISGADALLDGPGSSADGMVAEVLVSIPAVSIAGGTDEIQHNIIGERVLGLPKEPGTDAAGPFRKVRTNRAGSDSDEHS
jgi:alkylation response protein AidB-like acyl-CoA dehydrogenase